MFSDNHKISDRQLQALLLTDWIGKIVLLQPGLAREYWGSAVFWGTVAGLILTAVFLLLIMRSAWSSPVDYYSYIKRHEGKTAAVVLYLVYGIYFLEQTILLLFLCGEIAEIYLLPDTARPVLMLLPAVVGYFLARGGLEIRGRVSELLAWLMAVVLLLLLLLALFQIQPAQLLEAVSFGQITQSSSALQGSGNIASLSGIAQGSGNITSLSAIAQGSGSTASLPAIFRELPTELAGIGACICLTTAGFGSIWAIPLVLPGAEQKKGWKKKLYLAFGMAGIFLLLVYLAGYGTFGSAGMKRLSWPIISLMSCVNLQGMFLQRWDVLLTALLLVSLFLSVGSGIYYTEKVIMTLWENASEQRLLRKQGNAGEQRLLREQGNAGEQRLLREQENTGRRRTRVRLCCLALAYLLALKIRDWEQALFFYERISLWFCVPVLTLMVLLVRRKRRTKAAVGILAVFAAASFWLTGCSARELESRCFPLALEISVNDGQLVLGCAWPTVKENGGKQSQDNTAGSNEKAAEEIEEKAGQGNGKENENGIRYDLVNDDKITRVAGKSLEEAVKNVQSLRDKYVDYSQVKAILWGYSLENNPELKQEVLEWLENDPAFSRNILIFQGETQDLSLETIQEHAQGQPGAYLENLYKNNELFQKYTRTLAEVLYE